MKKLWSWIKDSFVEILNQTFTLLGFFTAWVLLEGSARKVIGYSIVIALIVWLISLRIREGDNDGED